MENNNSNANVTKTAKALNITAIALCVVLLPILVFNCILLVKGMLFADEIPSIGQYTPLIVESDSMEETIMTGDLIFIRKVNVNDLDEEAVITFKNPTGKGLVTHRIIEVIEDENGLSFLTQGDNNDIDDKNPIPASDVIGVWTGFRLPIVGSIMLFMQEPLGLLVCIFIPVACFVGCEIFLKQKKAKATQSDVDALRAELEALKKEKENSENK